MKQENGFALLVVLALLMGAAAIAVGAQAASRSGVREAAALVRQGQIEAALDGAGALAMADILAAGALTSDRQAAFDYQIGEARVRGRAVADAGLLNPNHADPREIAALLVAGGMDRSWAASTAGAIVRRRGERPFEHVFEMSPAFGARGDVLLRVAPLLTTRSSGAPDLRLSPAGLRAALVNANLFAAALSDLQDPSADVGSVALFLSVQLSDGRRTYFERIIAFSPDSGLLVLDQRSLSEADMSLVFGESH